jgi:Leucine-rich repeat (LRR) protein
MYINIRLRTHESDRDTPSLDKKLYSSFWDGFFLVETRTTGDIDAVRVAPRTAALMEIHASLVRANFTKSPPPWGGAGDDCCSWKRVRCSNVTHRVSHIDLSGGWAASPDSEDWSLNTTVFAAFPELQFLDLSLQRRPHSVWLRRYVYFPLLSSICTDTIGPIQFSCAGFKNLSNLRELHLWDNNISGILPSFLFSLPHIEVLDLSSNMLQGPIPISSSSNLSLSLRSLDLSDNDLSGRFPFIWLKNLINLVEIDLSGNANLGVNVNVPGWVPRFQLKNLSLSGCDLDKGIIAEPEFLGTRHRLEYLDLSNNNLSSVMCGRIYANRATRDLL